MKRRKEDKKSAQGRMTLEDEGWKRTNDDSDTDRIDASSDEVVDRSILTKTLNNRNLANLSSDPDRSRNCESKNDRVRNEERSPSSFSHGFGESDLRNLELNDREIRAHIVIACAKSNRECPRVPQPVRPRIAAIRGGISTPTERGKLRQRAKRNRFEKRGIHAGFEMLNRRLSQCSRSRYQ